MSDLINNVYLPDFKKRSIREGDAYKLLSENKKDTSVLEGYENHPDAGVVNFESFDKFLGEGGTKEEWIARHATPEVQKEFFSNVGDFMLETGKDTALSLATAVINGADVATNLMPLFVKAFDKAPLATGMPEGFLNEATEKQVYDFANNISNNLGEAREYLNEFKKDDNFVSQFVGVMSQDLLYSIPIYNKLRSAGMPKYPAFFISGGIGGAIGIEKEVMGARSTFSQEIFAKDIIELKNLVGILPDTPEDKIADEVIQALEYGAFSTAIPGIIDSFKFMKRYIPAMAGTTGAVVGMTADNEAEGSPIKAIVNAVNKVPIFKSAVRDAAEKKITKGNADQIYNTIKNTPGVKEAELKWLDLEDNLKARSQMKKAPLTKDEVLELIDGNKVDVSEVSFGGSASRLSDDLEQKILDFEQKVEKAARAQDLGYADINYDVYPYARRLAGNTNIDKVRKETSMDFSQLNDLLLGLPLNSKTFLKDYAGKKGQIEIHKFTDNLNNRPVYVGRELAEELINEKEVVRDIPAALNSPGTPRYTRNRVLEFEPLEIEKFLIEREKRIFMKDNASPKFERYTEPGGDDYTELVFKIKKGGMDIGIPTTRYDDNIKYTPYKNPSHMDVKSEIAHVRFKTRMNGNMKLLAVEEMQSDFGIRTTKIKKADMEQIDELSGEQLGLMADEAFPGNKFTVEEAQRKLKGNVKAYDFPFKNNWYEFTIKRLTRYAADNGFDAIAIPKGELAANRYGQEINKLKTIVAVPNGPGSARITFADDKGTIFKTVNFNPNLDKEGLFFETLKKYEKDVGSKKFPEFQQMVIDATDEEPIERFIKYDKEEIVGTGKGKYNLYDKTIPSYMKKYANKWNAKVYDYRLSNPENPSIPVTVLELSNEMKTGVTSSSQPLFELFGGVSLATWGAQAVSDSMENNIISQKTN